LQFRIFYPIAFLFFRFSQMQAGKNPDKADNDHTKTFEPARTTVDPGEIMWT